MTRRTFLSALGALPGLSFLLSAKQEDSLQAKDSPVRGSKWPVTRESFERFALKDVDWEKTPFPPRMKAYLKARADLGLDYVDVYPTRYGLKIDLSQPEHRQQIEWLTSHLPKTWRGDSCVVDFRDWPWECNQWLNYWAWIPVIREDERILPRLDSEFLLRVP